MSAKVKRQCQVQGCQSNAEHWRIELIAPNTTALNGQLCEHHYQGLLQVIREVINYALPVKTPAKDGNLRDREKLGERT